ncbi:MAG: hypothetical protein AB1505_14850, partial [Candidatus Latescibacterota bacterium]
MVTRRRSVAVLWAVVAAALPPSSSSGQSLKSDLQGVFDEVLKPTNEGGRLVLTGAQGAHGRHYLPSSVEASAATIRAFSSFLSANISSFPLGSTAAGMTFDFSGGAPVGTTTSLGPIFTERAQTVGRGRLNVGLNVSYLNLRKLRGVDTEDIRFTFFHDDVGGPGDIPPELHPSGVTGDDPSGNELDHIDLFMNMDLNATLAAFYVAYGVTDRLDVGVAVPYVTMSLDADPVARMNPLSVLSRGYQDTVTTINATPLHFWGSADSPLLTYDARPVRQNAVGLGDLALRAKYNLLRGQGVDVAGLVEYRPPTGNEDDFLGAGAHSLRGQVIVSAIRGDFSPHLNLGYDIRGSEFDRNEVELFTGYDQKIGEGLTLAVDFLGEFEVGSADEASDFPQTVRVQGSGAFARFTEVVSLTSVPNRARDHTLNGSFGLRFRPRADLTVVGNVLVPLNDGGIRSSAIP